jgi:transcriptional regulator with XRE-family HTH domain
MGIDYTAFGKNIRKFRAQAELTQEELSELVGCTDRHIGKIENGQNIPSLEVTVAIANALNVGIDQLLYGDLVNRTDYFIQELVSCTEGFDDKDKLTTITMIKSLTAILQEYKKN